MFSERYGLEQGVLAGTKTMTRRILKEPKKFNGVEETMLEFHKRLGTDFYYDCVVCDMNGHELGQLPLPYEIGDVVAIAQTYKRAGWKPDTLQYQEKRKNGKVVWRGDMEMQNMAGWTNKMFVHPMLMPWQIVIEDLWFERLQDISDADILREGIMEGEFMNTWDRFYFDHWGDVPNHITFQTARKAFAKLIDYVNGTGTWESNPWVVAYSFHLQRAHGFPER
jgi:hypothetical protein